MLDMAALGKEDTVTWESSIYPDLLTKQKEAETDASLILSFGDFLVAPKTLCWWKRCTYTLMDTVSVFDDILVGCLDQKTCFTHVLCYLFEISLKKRTYSFVKLFSNQQLGKP